MQMNSLGFMSGRVFPGTKPVMKAKRVDRELRRLTGFLNGSKLKALAGVRPEGQLEAVVGGGGGGMGCRNKKGQEKV